MQASLQLKLVATNRVVYLGLRCFERNYSILIPEQRSTTKPHVPLLSKPFVACIFYFNQITANFSTQSHFFKTVLVGTLMEGNRVD